MGGNIACCPFTALHIWHDLFACYRSVLRPNRVPPHLCLSPRHPCLSVKSPELKLQLLTRALEESRAKVARLEQDREAVSDALLQLCQPAGGGEGTDVAGNTAGVEGGDPAAGEAGLAGDDGAAALPLRLGMLGDRLAGLREALAAQEMATAEARAAHERAALQVVAQQQRREALEAQLEEASEACTCFLAVLQCMDVLRCRLLLASRNIG